MHGIVGENGRARAPDVGAVRLLPGRRGRIEVLGREARIRNADDAIALGVGMVHQHFMLVDTLTALENVMLGAEPHWLAAPRRPPGALKL